jgi:hypothetical protein
VDESKPVAWRRSQRCGEAGTCVEIAQLGELIGLRDAKNTAHPPLLFDRTAWRSFVAGIKAGEFE